MDLYYVSFAFLFSCIISCVIILYFTIKNVIETSKKEIQNIVETFANEREKSIKQYQELLANPVVYFDVLPEDQENNLLTDEIGFSKKDIKKKIFH